MVIIHVHDDFIITIILIAADNYDEPMEFVQGHIVQEQGILLYSVHKCTCTRILYTIMQ